MKFSQWLHENQMEFPNPKFYYLACVLTAKSQKDIYNAVNSKINQFNELQNIPRDWTAICHHMTVNFRPTNEDFQTNQPIFGQQVPLHVVGLAINENACAVVIESAVSVKNDIPHITIACSRNCSPVYSNELLKLSKVHSVNLGPFDSEFLAVKKDKSGYWPEPRVPMASFSLA